jgi:hypothetical protein
MTDNEIYLMIKKIFANAPRPEYFTNYLHCEECQEHDDLLRSKDVDSLSYEDIGNPGWSPVPFMTAEAIRYYFPALVRVAFDPSHKGNPLNFVGSLFSNLDSDDMGRFTLFNSAERKSVLALLNHLKGSLSERFGFDEDEFAELEPLIVKWTKFSADD